MSTARNGDMAAIQATLEEENANIPLYAPPPPDTEELQLDAAAATTSPTEQVRENLRLEAEAKKAEEEAQQKKEHDMHLGIATTTGVMGLTSQAYQDAHNHVQKTTDKVMTTAKQGWRGLGQVSTPGSIFLPVALLLVFFFLLLPVGGNTRASWLWMALTGNASISGSLATNQGGQEEDIPASDVTTTPASYGLGYNFTGVGV